MKLGIMTRITINLHKFGIKFQQIIIIPDSSYKKINK
jgi:hypothetical protein